ncbi:unnamed protein product [Rodentolepis nana]|uniref:Uncharacterized protein n=1 Tax=Rodentolepis nana TaxID=102285 RepID=A0A0R3TV50_RODNA|nr:unnamed protein product [Rodentolepis nana]
MKDTEKQKENQVTVMGSVSGVARTSRLDLSAVSESRVSVFS